MFRCEVLTVADPEQESSVVSVDIFVDLAGWVQNELTRVYRDFFFIHDHVAATFETKINFCSMGMAMIGADLAGLPTRHGNIATRLNTQDFLHMFNGRKFLLRFQVKGHHPKQSLTRPRQARCLRGMGRRIRR